MIKEIIEFKNFSPAFVRIVRARGDIIYFDYENGEYIARDKDKYPDLELNYYLKQIEYEHGLYEYHIAVKSIDNKRVLLVFESDKKGGEEVIKKLSRLCRERGLQFILKTSGNRSLHLIIPTIARSEEEYKTLWNCIFDLLSEEERAFIDKQLCNYNGQIRGFESLHLKTLNKSKVLAC